MHCLQDPAVLSGEITNCDLDALSAEGWVVRGHGLGCVVPTRREDEAVDYTFHD
jgi:hypothetical protein